MHYCTVVEVKNDMPQMTLQPVVWCDWVLPITHIYERLECGLGCSEEPGFCWCWLLQVWPGFAASKQLERQPLDEKVSLVIVVDQLLLYQPDSGLWPWESPWKLCLQGVPSILPVIL